MPQKRQSADIDPEGGIVVRSLGLRLPSGHRLAPHAHPWHQLVYATEGVMTVETSDGTWVVPPQRAVWIPAQLEHGVQMTGGVRMRTLYLRPDRVNRVPLACCVINVTPLLRELILETMRAGMLVDAKPEQARLAGVIHDQITSTREAPLRIVFPSDARARRVVDNVQADLSATAALSDLVKGTGASVRTIERLFRAQTGLTFGRWLQKMKALHALQRLAAGDSVTTAGQSIGYASTSAFIAMFKRVLGTTPGCYFAG